MMRQRFTFGKWMPDLAPLRQQGTAIARAENVLAVPGGYRAARSLTRVNQFQAALPGTPVGVIRGVLSDGTSAFIAATDTGLFRLVDNLWSDVSRTSGYRPATGLRWESDQFGDEIFFSRRANPLQALSFASASRFEDVPDAPRAAHVATAENFLWVGDIISRTLGVARDAVAWSAVGAPRVWPTPGTDEATSVLSGEQRLEGDGGIVQGIVAGAEVVAVFQENAIHRADFVGNDVVWRFSRVETRHGLAIPDAAVAFERMVFFISDDGFRVFNYTSSTNIGKGVVNEFFTEDYDFNFPDKVTLVKDPNDTKIWVSYPTKTSGGSPGRILVWDWVLDQWTLLNTGLHNFLLKAGEASPSLDSADTVDDPDRIGGASADTDSPGNESFDAREILASQVAVGAFDAGGFLSTFTGTPSFGVLETGDLELAAGRRALLTRVRPLVDGAEATVQVAGLDRRADDVNSVTFGAAAPMGPDGTNPVRVDARYHRIRFNLPSLLSDATDFDVEFRPTGFF